MITISSSIPGKGNFKIMLEKTGPTACYVSIDTWPDGVPAAGTPTGHNEYDIKNVSVIGETAKGALSQSVMGFDPEVAIALSGDNQPTSVDVNITHAFLWNGDTNYPINQTDHDALKAWLRAFVEADV